MASFDETCFQPVMTFQEIGDVMGLTRQRVEQIYSRAMQKMRRSASRKEILGLLRDAAERGAPPRLEADALAIMRGDNDDFRSFAAEMRALKGQLEIEV